MQKDEGLIAYAEQDFKAACVIMRADCPLLMFALHHAHRCAEWAMKAFLAAQGEVPPKSHDLVYLNKLCVGYDAGFDTMCVAVDLLSPYTDEICYPNDSKLLPDCSLAEDGIKKAKMILDFVRERLDAQ